MKRWVLIAAFILAAWVIPSGTASPQAAPRQEHSKRPLRESEIQGVIQAVQDEIYDLHLEKEYFDLGPERHKIVLNIYFDPEVLDDSYSWVIYKLMPGGEVYREYQIGVSGRIYLHLKPGEFRLTQPSFPTVYMDDDELIQTKHDWIKRQFVVDTDPPPALTAAAHVRQADRECHTRGPSGEPPPPCSK